MADTQTDPNLLIYKAPAVVEHYAALDYLTACERLLFATYLRPGMAILDLGVGGGRTTAYLSSLAERYVGVDYALTMVAACRSKFPHLDFEVGDAADLSRFSAAIFDAVVMAFNGIDYLIPDEARFSMLRETHRVLKPGGILIFSSHNPRAIRIPALWNPERVRIRAEKIVSSASVWFRATLWSLTALRGILAGLQSVGLTMERIARRVPTRAFWRRQGYWTDPSHGGLKTHSATPEEVMLELKDFGFRPLRVLGDDYPQASGPFVTDWYYYVFSKTEAIGKK